MYLLLSAKRVALVYYCTDGPNQRCLYVKVNYTNVRWFRYFYKLLLLVQYVEI